MKIRSVTCIHVAAYLFSGLVLGASAFSHYRSITMFWISDTTLTDTYIHNQVHVDDGYVIIDRFYDLMWAEPFEFFLHDPESIDSVLDKYEVYGKGERRRFRFLSVIYLANIRENGEIYSWFTAVPLRSFLFLPLAWMCIFHLCNLRQHIRSRRALKMNSVAP